MCRRVVKRMRLASLIAMLTSICVFTYIAPSLGDAGSQALVLMQLCEMRAATSALISADKFDDPAWRAAAAIACLAAGEFKSAHKIALSALEQCQDETLMLAAALSAIGCGDNESAVQILTQLVASQPKRHQVLPKLLLKLLGINASYGDGVEACEDAVAFLHSFLLMQHGNLAAAKECLQRLREDIANRGGSSRLNAIVRISLVATGDNAQLVMLTPHADAIPRETIQRILMAALGSASVAYQTASIRRAPPILNPLAKEKPGDEVRLVSGKIKVSVDTSALTEASHVTFYVDCQPRHTATNPPFVWEWDTGDELPGTHTLTVIVFRRDGSACAASSQRVLVVKPLGNTARIGMEPSNDAPSAPVIRRAIRMASDTAEQAQVEASPTVNTCSAQLCFRMPPIRLIDVDTDSVEHLLGLVCAALGNHHEAFHILGKLYWRTRNEAFRGQLLKLRRAMMSQMPQRADVPLIVGSIPVRGKAVALTFDDGPRPPYTERILELLSRYNAKATFFVVGEMARLYPELLRAIVSAGHEVGNHSYTHTPLRMLTKSEIDSELLLTDIAISEACGIHPVFFRPPGGGMSEQLISALSEQRYSCVLWNINIGSYRGTPREVASQMLRAVKDGSIILMHNGMDMSVDVLPHLLEGLRALGYEVTSVGEMLGISGASCDSLKQRR